MVVAVAQAKTYTVDEYLALEMASEVRSEYRDGEIWPMTGGTPTHNKLAGNLNALLWFGLRGQPYDLFIADQRLAIPQENLYTYPDVMVVPRPIELLSGRKDTVINPILIAEVLSDSTKAYDRAEKFAAYRTIPAFREYVLIEQSRVHVEHYVKQGVNQWLFTEYDGLAARLTLATVMVEIGLADLYEAVEFGEVGADVS